MENTKVTIAIILVVFILSPLSIIRGAVSFYETNIDFNPNQIISDISLTDYNSMTVQQIRDFVESKGGTLGTYIDPQVNLPAYWVIWQTAQEYKINPKFILTMLQKEMSLVTDGSPTQNQYDWAVGYSCYGGICLDNYKGFSTQIKSMANKFINSYLADLKNTGKHIRNFNCTFTKWCVGVVKETQDEQVITPENYVTAALYTYNPYRGGTILDGYKIGANYNFWKIWNNWFEKEIFRPNGSILKTASSEKVYLLKNGKKRPFASFSSFITRYNIEDIIIVNQSELDQYETDVEIKFPQYSLLVNSTGNIYLLVDDSLRHISSMEVFRTLGFNPEEVEPVDDVDLVGLEEGPEITLASAYPKGALIQDSSTGGIYYIENGIKYPIYSKEILKANYSSQKIMSGHPDELEKYPKGDAVLFKDGTLIKSVESDIVYVISDGRKLPIADEMSFNSRGYKWNKIIETTQRAVDIHSTGPALEYLDTSLIPKTAAEAEAEIKDLIELNENLGVFDELESLLDNPTTTLE